MQIILAVRDRCAYIGIVRTEGNETMYNECMFTIAEAALDYYSSNPPGSPRYAQNVWYIAWCKFGKLVNFGM